MLEKFLLTGCVVLSILGVSASNGGAQQELSLAAQQVVKPQDITLDQQQSIFKYAREAVEDQCKVQPAVPWCNPGKLPHKTLSAYEIVDRSLEAKSTFNYLADVEDTWRDHSYEASSKLGWYGDCDDLTSTTLSMLVRAGQPRNKIWMVLADVYHKTIIDHLVGMVQDKDGKFWIVGDTSRQNAYPASRVEYRIVGVARGDHMTVWEDPHAVGAFPTTALQSSAPKE